ncbi:MAG: hypothetical protein CSA49_03490 [Gammaproteobacteria bacterium]|nr:MAG: hypothetical protein CSA49_03490 [Gammaproteobacteria bacterium]
MKPQIAAIVLSTAFLGGCSALEQLPVIGSPDPIITNLMGKPTSYLKDKLGLPNRRQDSASGAMVWTYLDNEKGVTAKSCEVSLSIRDDIVEHVYISRQNKSLASFATSACDRIRDQVRG